MENSAEQIQQAENQDANTYPWELKTKEQMKIIQQADPEALIAALIETSKTLVDVLMHGACGELELELEAATLAAIAVQNASHRIRIEAHKREAAELIYNDKMDILSKVEQAYQLRSTDDLKGLRDELKAECEWRAERRQQGCRPASSSATNGRRRRPALPGGEMSCRWQARTIHFK